MTVLLLQLKDIFDRFYEPQNQPVLTLFRQRSICTARPGFGVIWLVHSHVCTGIIRQYAYCSQRISSKVADKF